MSRYVGDNTTGAERLMPEVHHFSRYTSTHILWSGLGVRSHFFRQPQGCYRRSEKDSCTVDELEQSAIQMLGSQQLMQFLLGLVRY